MPTMLTNLETMYDNNWYPDSRAVNQIIADVGSLTIETRFFGIDQVYMCNGKGFIG